MNQLIELNNKLTNDSLAVLKQFSELNVKTTEAFVAQQKEVTEKLAATAKQNVEKLSATKDPKAFLELQSEMLQNSMTAAMDFWKTASSTAESNSAAYKKLSEKSLKTAKSDMDEVVKAAKETAETATASIKKAAETATASVKKATKAA